MRILVTRGQMIGGGLTYDVYVPDMEAPIAKAKCGHFTQLETAGIRRYFVDLTHALLPATHYAIMPGAERWEEFKMYDRKAQRLKLDIAERAFPELAKVRARGDETLSGLWYNGLLTPEPKGHVDIWVDVDIMPNPVGWPNPDPNEGPFTIKVLDPLNPGHYKAEHLLDMEAARA